MIFFQIHAGYGDYFPYSRDYATPRISCKVKDCPANNGYNECIATSCAVIGPDGVCEMFKKLQKDKKEQVVPFTKKKKGDK